ncbi:MAG: alpha/beta hydrolase-fold protein [bacterium]
MKSTWWTPEELKNILNRERSLRMKNNQMKSVVLCFVLVLILNQAGTAQQKNPFLENELSKNITKEVSIRYMLHLPERYDSLRHHLPLLLYLHGGMGRGNDFQKLSWYPIPKMILENSFPDSFVVIIPQCSEGKDWTEYTDTLKELLSKIINDYSIDTTRIYGIGYSMGGNGIAHFAYMNPEIFAAFAPMSGFYNTSWASRLKQIPVWFFHGAKDSTLQIDDADKLVEALKQLNAEVKYTRDSEGEHSPPTAEQHLQVLQWFLQHSKKNILTYPSELSQ